MGPNVPLNFVVIDYTSKYSPHTCELSTNDYSNSGFTDPGTFLAWDGSFVSGPAMINDLINLMLPVFPTTTSVDGWTIYTRASPTARRIPRYGSHLAGMVGSSPITGWEQAVQRTYNMLTADANPVKLVLLDTPTDNNFGRYTSLSGAEAAMIAQLQLAGKAWAGRDGKQIALFRDETIKTNDRLRRSYKIS